MPSSARVMCPTAKPNFCFPSHSRDETLCGLVMAVGIPGFFTMMPIHSHQYSRCHLNGLMTMIDLTLRPPSRSGKSPVRGSLAS